MKGRKLAKRKVMIFIVAIIIAIANVSLYTNKSEKMTEVIVVGEIDTTKNLDQQLEKFSVVKVVKSESMKYGNSIVRDLRELQGKRLMYELPSGSPIPKSLLIDADSFGQFAAETKPLTTVYKLAGAVEKLPKGIKPGDKIDIAILTQEDGGDLRLDMLMTGVPIHTITETDVYVLVSQKNAGILTVAEKKSEFVLQLPGQKKVANCKDVEKENGETEECYNEEDALHSIKYSDIMKSVRDGMTINAGQNENNAEETGKMNEENSMNTPDSTDSEIENRQERDEMLNNSLNR